MKDLKEYMTNGKKYISQAKYKEIVNRKNLEHENFLSEYESIMNERQPDNKTTPELTWSQAVEDSITNLMLSTFDSAIIAAKDPVDAVKEIFNLDNIKNLEMTKTDYTKINTSLELAAQGDKQAITDAGVYIFMLVASRGNSDSVGLDTDKINGVSLGNSNSNIITGPTTVNKKPDVSCLQYCFTAGTLIHTANGTKPIEQIGMGEMIWSREEFGDKYGYRPVVNTVVTHDVPIYAVTVRHDNGLEETFNTTEEHPFYIDGQGWRKASILESGMRMLDKDGNATAQIISQEKLDETDTVYNFEVQYFHTYHIGEIGLWVHNAKCCDFTKTKWGDIQTKFTQQGWVDPKNGNVRYLDPFDGKMKDFPDDALPSVDHIYPRSKGNKLNQEGILTKTELDDILNSADNLMPLPRHLNSSKGAKIEFVDGGWVQYGNKGNPIPIDAGYKDFLEKAQNKIMVKIQKAIEVKKGIK